MFRRLMNDPRFDGVPMVTSVFNTGYMETASSLHSLVSVLETLASGEKFWPQRMGMWQFDDAPKPENPKKILCLASSHIGNNYAVVIGRE